MDFPRHAPRKLRNSFIGRRNWRELRAAMSLARLWRDQVKRQQARELLAPVYGWFTERLRYARSERGECATRRASEAALDKKGELLRRLFRSAGADQWAPSEYPIASAVNVGSLLSGDERRIFFHASGSAFGVGSIRIGAAPESQRPRRCWLGKISRNIDPPPVR